MSKITIWTDSHTMFPNMLFWVVDASGLAGGLTPVDPPNEPMNMDSAELAKVEMEMARVMRRSKNGKRVLREHVLILGLYMD